MVTASEGLEPASAGQVGNVRSSPNYLWVSRYYVARGQAVDPSASDGSCGRQSTYLHGVSCPQRDVAPNRMGLIHGSRRNWAGVCPSAGIAAPDGLRDPEVVLSCHWLLNWWK